MSLNTRRLAAEGTEIATIGEVDCRAVLLLFDHSTQRVSHSERAKEPEQTCDAHNTTAWEKFVVGFMYL